MKENFRSLNWRKLILVSLMFGGLFGAFAPNGIFTRTAFMQSYGGGPGSWVCPDGGTIDCKANGCRQSSNQPDSYWVCNYIGTNCPPLEQCRKK